MAGDKTVQVARFGHHFDHVRHFRLGADFVGHGAQARDQFRVFEFVERGAAAGQLDTALQPGVHAAVSDRFPVAGDRQADIVQRLVADHAQRLQYRQQLVAAQRGFQRQRQQAVDQRIDQRGGLLGGSCRCGVGAGGQFVHVRLGRAGRHRVGGEFGDRWQCRTDRTQHGAQRCGGRRGFGAGNARCISRRFIEREARFLAHGGAGNRAAGGAHGGRRRRRGRYRVLGVGRRGRSVGRIGVTLHQHVVVVGAERAFHAFLGLVFLDLVIGEDAGDEHAREPDQTQLEICHAACTSVAKLAADCMSTATMRDTPCSCIVTPIS